MSEKNNLWLSRCVCTEFWLLQSTEPWSCQKTRQLNSGFFCVFWVLARKCALDEFILWIYLFIYPLTHLFIYLCFYLFTNLPTHLHIMIYWIVQSGLALFCLLDENIWKKVCAFVLCFHKLEKSTTSVDILYLKRKMFTDNLKNELIDARFWARNFVIFFWALQIIKEDLSVGASRGGGACANIVTHAHAHTLTH